MTRRGLSQVQRVHRALILVGAAGLTQADFDHPDDGGPPVRRLASRVDELRKAGHLIETLRDDGVARYVLRPHVARKAGQSPDPSAAPAPTAPAPPVARRSPYGPWGDGA